MNAVRQFRRSSPLATSLDCRGTKRLSTPRFDVLEDRLTPASFIDAGGTLGLSLAAGETLQISANNGQYEFALANGSWTGSDTNNVYLGGDGILRANQPAAFSAGISILGENGSNAIQFNSGNSTFQNNVAISLDNALATSVGFAGIVQFDQNLSIQTSGNITQTSGAVVVLGTARLNTAADIAITSVDNQIAIAQLTATNASIASKYRIIDSYPLENGGTLQYISRALDLGACTIAGNLFVETKGVLYGDNGAVVVGGTATFQTNRDDVYLTDPNNDFNTIVAPNALWVRIVDRDNIDLGNIVARGEVDIRAGGPITQSHSIRVPDEIFLKATGSDITLDDGANYFGAGITILDARNVSMAGYGGTYLENITVSGHLTMKNSGYIEQDSRSKVTVGGDFDLSAGDYIFLGYDSKITVGGDWNLIAAGDVEQYLTKGIVVAGATTFDVGEYNITLNRPANDFSEVSFLAAGDVILTDANDIVLPNPQNYRSLQLTGHVVQPQATTAPPPAPTPVLADDPPPAPQQPVPPAPSLSETNTAGDIPVAQQMGVANVLMATSSNSLNISVASSGSSFATSTLVASAALGTPMVAPAGPVGNAVSMAAVSPTSDRTYTSSAGATPPATAGSDNTADAASATADEGSIPASAGNSNEHSSNSANQTLVQQVVDAILSGFESIGDAVPGDIPTENETDEKPSGIVAPPSNSKTTTDSTPPDNSQAADEEAASASAWAALLPVVGIFFPTPKRRRSNVRVP